MKLLSCRPVINRESCSSLNVEYFRVQFKPGFISTNACVTGLKHQQCVCAWGQLGNGSMKGASGVSAEQVFTSHWWMLLVQCSTACSVSSTRAEKACGLCHLSCPRSNPLRPEGALLSALLRECTVEAVLNADGKKCLCLWGFSAGRFFHMHNTVGAKAKWGGQTKFHCQVPGGCER